jgi:hypothetical protein
VNIQLKSLPKIPSGVSGLDEITGLPSPLKRIIGDLPNKDRVVIGLEIDPLGTFDPLGMWERAIDAGLQDSQGSEQPQLRLFVSGAASRSLPGRRGQGQIAIWSRLALLAVFAGGPGLRAARVQT